MFSKEYMYIDVIAHKLNILCVCYIRKAPEFTNQYFENEVHSYDKAILL